MTLVSLCKNTKKYNFDKSLKVPSHVREIENIRQHLEGMFDLLKYPVKIKMSIFLALDEAMANAIEHGNIAGNPPLEVAYSLTEHVCILQVVDFGGHTFNPEYFERLATIKDWGMGGRGIFLIKKIMDEVYYFFDPGKSTTLVMIKYSSPEAVPPSVPSLPL
ncbi:MAG: ATP-binding protein [Candidatus Riflebacteria bacterium]|nr:ATP-binding protein [Candidatus Riflebacteria bacterium]